MGVRNFNSVLEAIKNNQKQLDLKREALGAMLRVVALSAGAGAIMIGGAWLNQYPQDAYGWWPLLTSILAAVVLLISGLKYGVRAMDVSRLQDRNYFLQCIDEARTWEELVSAGFTLKENVVGVAADELAQQWDVFGRYNDERERMLIKLHSHADLRKLADQIDEMEDQRQTEEAFKENRGE
jgi:hypothetical protein